MLCLGDDLTWLDWFGPTNNAECQAAALMAGDSSGMVTVWPVMPKLQGETYTNNASKTPKFLHGFGFQTVGYYCLPGVSKPRLAVLYEDHFLRVWDLQQDTVIKTFELSIHAGPNQSNEEEEMEEEEPPKMVLLASPPVHHPQEGLLAAASSDGHLIFIPCSQSNIDSSDAVKVPVTHLSTHRVRDKTHIEALDYSSTHSYLAYGTISGLLGIYDVGNMRLRQEWVCRLHEQIAPVNWDPSRSVGITHLKWSKRKPVFFTATLANCVLLWSGLMLSEIAGESPTPLAVYWGHRNCILDLCLRPNEQTEEQFATCSDDVSVKVFPVQTNPEIAATLNSLGQISSNIVSM
ncbi:hypothetical protein Ciccas_010946 [Cichlidogyrus casuarinus]|uniref:Uncharacterized protein n=1 Tax=Cichlidogyrus casuarinus TaxID=1844966 RepID=A0ABD2PTU4_9PLAT